MSPDVVGRSERDLPATQIEYLGKCPQFVDQVARWYHAEWGHMRPGDSVEARAERLRAFCGLGGVPAAFVAFNNCTPCGAAMLIANDMDTHPELTPWLAGVYVAPEFRKQGIATALINRVVAEAKQAGVSKLYLFTPDQDAFYSRRGWTLTQRDVYRGMDVVIMNQLI